MAGVKALCFDLDDTLLESGRLARAVEGVCTMLAMRTGIDVASLLQANNEAWQTYWPTIEQDWTLGKLDTPSIGLEAWARTLRACGCDALDLPYRARDMAWELQFEGIRVFDDVAAQLSSLQERYPLALITNGASDLQREKVRRLSIEHHFNIIVISDEAGCCKPDPAVFRHALDKLGVEANASWHIGDSPANDVDGARAAGMTGVWLNRERKSWPASLSPPVHEIASLAEVWKLLEA